MPAVLAFFCLGGSAEASLRFEIRTSNGAPYIQVSGEFEYEDSLNDFSRIVRDKHPTFVTFDSPGGNIAKALELGRLIRKTGLNTFGSRSLECDSACAFAFMGGVQRTAEPDSIGMHKASLASPRGVSVEDAVQTIQELTALVVEYMSDMGIDSGLLKVALSANSDDIRYLTSGEMQRYHVTTGTNAPTLASTDEGNSPGNDGPGTDQRSAPTPRTNPNTRTGPDTTPDSNPDTLTSNPNPDTGDTGNDGETKTASVENDPSLPYAKPLPKSDAPPSANTDTGFVIPPAQSGRIRHPDGEAPLKAVANERSRNLTDLANGTPVKIMDDSGPWYRVDTPRGIGYIHESWVFVDQFQGGPFESRYIELKSFRDFGAAEAYIRDSSLPLVAELARGGRFNVALRDSYSVAAGEALLAKLKARDLVPADAFITYGNTYVRVVCCDQQ